MKAVAREIAEKIAADARMRLICMKPHYDTIDLGESLILAAMRDVARPEAVTDEMVAAGVEAWHRCDTNLLLDDEIRAIITAALSKVSPLIVGGE